MAACRPRQGCKLYDAKTDVRIEEVKTHKRNEIFVEFSCKWTQGLLRVNSARTSNLVYKWTATGRRHAERRGT